MPRIRLLAAIGVIALAGCGRKDTDPGAGGVTVGEARALDDAAQMLEQRPAPPQVGVTGLPAGESSPVPGRPPAP